MELSAILENRNHYKVFPIIYSIRGILAKYDNYPTNLCRLCFMNYMECFNKSEAYKSESTGESDDSESEQSDEYININLAVVNILSGITYSENMLCAKCICGYSKKDVLVLIQNILNQSYHKEGNVRFVEFIRLFRSIDFSYVTYPYEKLLVEYFSYDMDKYYAYHKKCKHFTGISNACDNAKILCPIIVDIISHITHLYYTDFLKTCPLHYMEFLLMKGININHVFVNGNITGQTVFGALLYRYITGDYCDDDLRIKKLVALGADVNEGNPVRYITGIQYDDRQVRVEKIKYLIKIGVKFNNKCIVDCPFSETCKSHKMLYDTRLGKLIQSLK